MPDKFEKIDTCPYCGCNSFVKFLSAPDRFSKRNEVFDTMKCAQCGLVFQNPRVKEEFIGEYYAEGDDLGYYRIPFPRQKTLLVKIKEFISKQTLIQHLEYNSLGRKNIFMKLIVFPFIRVLKIKSTPTFVPGGRLFEIGCSHGEHLKEMKGLGWDVSGLEMSERMAEYAESIGLNVVAKRIEDVEYSDNSFNVVTMSMVLEHLYDPFGNLVRITKWLKPKGQLIFSIPYIKGVEFNIFKEYAYGLQLPHHITFMNKKIIRDCLTELGYRNIKFYFHFFDRDVVVPAQWKYQENGGFIYKLLGHNKIVRYFFIKPFVFLLSFFQKTSRVSVYAEKI